MIALRWFALTVRFLLELAALAALVYAGVASVDGAAGWLVGVVLALIAGVVWGRYVAPRASHPPRTPARLAIEAAVFVAATVGLLIAGEFGWAALLLGAYLVDRLVLWAAGAPAFEPDRRPGRPR
ncbi:MAG: YrdB family protein [Micromonosporaceae bacterium]